MTLSEIKCRTITITEQLQLQLNYATMHIKQFSHFKNLSIHRKQFSHFKTQVYINGKALYTIRKRCLSVKGITVIKIKIRSGVAFSKLS